jgi:hypothetical protein
VDLHSNAITAALLTESSPISPGELEHRVGLLGALLCAWAASCWHESPEQRTPTADMQLAV